MVQTVLDTPDPRALAEFYRDLLGWTYRPGDEPPAAAEPDPNGQDWLVLRPPGGGVQLAFQKVDELARSTWPDQAVPQQLHLDLAVPTEEELSAKHDQALRLGAQVLLDRTDDPDEPLWVFADLAGHPFCIFVAPDAD
jgi:catechol 2,3-dioxygenase-like lactoylglutathione lyase family enzyme